MWLRWRWRDFGSSNGNSAVVRAGDPGFGFAGLWLTACISSNAATRSTCRRLFSSNHDWLLVLAWTVIVFYLILSISSVTFRSACSCFPSC